jgi:hypothetical protein
MQGASEAARVRLPRHFDETGLVLPYDAYLAESYQVLHTIDSSQYALSFPLFHLPRLGSPYQGSSPFRSAVSDYLLLSNMMVFRLHGSKLHHLKVRVICF